MSYPIKLNEYDVEIMAKTIWGEARGECELGKKAVACVILNRLISKAWYSAPSAALVCLKKLQFSCWNANDPNSQKINKLNYIELKPYIQIVRDAVRDGDCTGGATHYHTDKIMPSWAKGAELTAVIGHHLFYKGVK